MSDYPSDEWVTKLADELYRASGGRTPLASARYFVERGICWASADRKRMISVMEAMRETFQHDRADRSWCWMCGLSMFCEHEAWCVAEHVDGMLGHAGPRNVAGPGPLPPTSADKPPHAASDYDDIVVKAFPKFRRPHNPSPHPEPTSEPQADPWALPAEDWRWGTGRDMAGVLRWHAAMRMPSDEEAAAVHDLVARRNREDPPQPTDPGESR
jgi:hypothetical protein